MNTRFPTIVDFGKGSNGLVLGSGETNKQGTTKYGDVHQSQEDSHSKAPIALEQSQVYTQTLELFDKHDQRSEILEKDKDILRINRLMDMFPFNNQLHRDRGAWLTADEKKLTDLIISQANMPLGNCDLPVSVNQLLAPSTDSCFTQDDGTCSFYSKVNNGAETKFCKRKHASSSPWDIPCHQYQPSSASQRTKSLGDTGCGEKAPEFFSEALCRSQTRARESEKLAAQARLEYEHLLDLFMKEAGLSFTFKHWIALLEIENMQLKQWQPPRVPDRKDCNHQNDFMHSSIELLKELAPGHCTLSDMNQKNSDTSHENCDSIGCALGLALALGFSLASVSVAAGLKMGWIRFRA